MSSIPIVDFCGMTLSRLLLGGNPFGGFSHQNRERDADMVGYYTVERIVETWRRAEAAGITAFVTNNETPHVVRAVQAYLGNGGQLQWIAQLNASNPDDMPAHIDRAVAIGCRAVYIHGAMTDNLFSKRNVTPLAKWCDHAHRAGIPIGVAAHAPAAHLWVHSFNLVDFHAVCFFNCGSLHDGKGERFRLRDMPVAVDVIRRIEKPCIAYKIMGAGRIDARMAMEFAFENIKPGDVINVGMHRGDRDDMVELNAEMAGEILSASDR